ncbi:MAG: hypothetical protein JXD23_16375 [Spirochaetales bacterium]|nr:hypothetical protein [Spirochaetales bacterium]
MEDTQSSIPIFYTDTRYGGAAGASPGTGFTRHFTQSEDFFIKFDFEYLTPRFKIHHDIDEKKPDDDYLAALDGTLSILTARAPEVFFGLTYFFDPQEIFKPCFFRIHESGGELFFYLLRLDFGFRPNYQSIVDRGDNDVSHVSRTDCLFLEPLLIPLLGFEGEGASRRAVVKSLISRTWIGEYGRGYFRQGIWMDNDLTKFFTRLFLDPDRRPYPYYPFQCNYRTVCAMPASFGEESRDAAAASLKEAVASLEPALPAVQDALKKAVFSEDLPVFRELKNRALPAAGAAWKPVSIRAYLNAQGLKEYQIEDDAPVA